MFATGGWTRTGNHGRPTSRCRHGHTSTQRAGQPRPKTLYIREDRLVEEINIRLSDQDHDGHVKLELDRTNQSRRGSVARLGTVRRLRQCWMATGDYRLQLDQETRRATKIAFRDPWGNTVSETILLANYTP